MSLVIYDQRIEVHFLDTCIGGGQLGHGDDHIRCLRCRDGCRKARLIIIHDRAAALIAHFDSLRHNGADAIQHGGRLFARMLARFAWMLPRTQRPIAQLGQVAAVKDEIGLGIEVVDVVDRAEQLAELSGYSWFPGTLRIENTTDAVDAMVKVMAPYIGNTMARSATEAHCQKLGIDGTTVSREQVEALLAKLGGDAGVRKVGDVFARELAALGFETRWVDQRAEVGAGHVLGGPERLGDLGRASAVGDERQLGPGWRPGRLAIRSRPWLSSFRSLPSRFMTNRWGVCDFVRNEVNATRLPSGDQAGSKSPPGAVGNCLRPVPSMLTNHKPAPS